MKQVPRYAKSSLGILQEFRKGFVKLQSKLYAQYGDICHCKIFNFNLYFVNNPKYLKHVLFDKRQNYPKIQRVRALQPLLGKYGLITTNDQNLWKKDKRVLMPSFQETHFEHYANVITKNCQEMLETWEEYANKKQPINVDSMMVTLTLKSLLNTLFTDISFDLAHFSHLLRAGFIESEKNFKSPLGIRWRAPAFTQRKFQKLIKEIHGFILKIIEERRASKKSRNDVLDALIDAYKDEPDKQKADEHIRDELLTLLAAGHETTVMTLNWAWILLSEHPEVARRMQKELKSVLGDRVPTYHDLTSLPYTQAVFLETMRLYPPIPMYSRTALADDEIDGYHIPANSIIAVAVHAVHRRPDYWENPQGFDPDRFVNMEHKEESLFAYLPFGGGPRICLGKNFAITEGTLILAMIAQKYQLFLPPDFEITIEPGFVSRPNVEIFMQLKKVSH